MKMKNKIIIYVLAAACAVFLTACGGKSEQQRQAEALLCKKVHPGEDVKVLSFDFVDIESVKTQLTDRIGVYRSLCDNIEAEIALFNELNDEAVRSKSTKLAELTGQKLSDARQRFEKACVKLDQLTGIYNSYNKKDALQCSLDLNYLEHATYYVLRYKIGFQTGTMLVRFRENFNDNQCSIVAYRDLFCDWVTVGNWYQIPGFTDDPPYVN